MVYFSRVGNNSRTRRSQIVVITQLEILEHYNELIVKIALAPYRMLRKTFSWILSGRYLDMFKTQFLPKLRRQALEHTNYLDSTVLQLEVILTIIITKISKQIAINK